MEYLDKVEKAREDGANDDGVTTICTGLTSHLLALSFDLSEASKLGPHHLTLQHLEDAEHGEEKTIGDLTPFQPDESMGEADVAIAQVAENRRFLVTGELSPAPHSHLEIFTEPSPHPRDKLHSD